MRYAESVPVKPSIPCKVDEMNRLMVGTVRYCQGDMVHVYSTFSGETFSGIITAISATDVVVRCGSGTRIAVLIGMLRSGRATISFDTDSADAASMVNQAGAILLEQSARAAHAQVPTLSLPSHGAKSSSSSSTNGRNDRDTSTHTALGTLADAGSKNGAGGSSSSSSSSTRQPGQGPQSPQGQSPQGPQGRGVGGGSIRSSARNAHAQVVNPTAS